MWLKTRSVILKWATRRYTAASSTRRFHSVSSGEAAGLGALRLAEVAVVMPDSS